ncbi:hypothetical protein F4810DRAFT_607720 [Camillea tinctor]|nr:hypothetical protein F4810DRAFT_607720 [Camillea tinctor]
MVPIRVALIGLSASAKTSWAEDAHLPYLLSPLGRPHYEIVALLNSSTEAAQAARKHSQLPPSVRTYGDPEQLAADAQVDLVVCSTRVDKHIPTTAASLKAGKAVFIEWPLAASYAEAMSLTGDLSTSIAGLQSRVSPVVLKIRQVLASGRIGRVLSSEVRARAAPTWAMTLTASPSRLRSTTTRRTRSSTSTGTGRTGRRRCLRGRGTWRRYTSGMRAGGRTSSRTGLPCQYLRTPSGLVCTML